MSSRKEDEKNEKIIRGLMKLPPNRKCINCNSLGPQYVCTNFWTFVCITCSGIHREFTHRVKSVSMAKFTSQEVDSLQRFGNQRAREVFLKDWDVQLQRLPDSSNPDKIREFIKNVYVERKYAGGKTADKPPRDTQINKRIEEDHRRASSYHSFSQSPPYDHQYEDRRYGKQAGILSRKPGSDRGHYDGKVSSFVYSPGRIVDHAFEDQSAKESSSTRASDFSASSTGNPFSFDSQSTDFQRSSGYCSPPVSDLPEGVKMLENPRSKVEGQSHPQETVSSGSLGSLNLSESSSGTQLIGTSFPSMLPSSGFIGTAAPDFFNSSSVQLLENPSAPKTDLFAEIPHQNKSSSPLDFFADVNHTAPNKTSAPMVDFFACMNQQNSVVTEQQLSSFSFTENERWATFDLPNEAILSPKRNQDARTVASPVQSNTDSGSFSLITDQVLGQTVDTNRVHGSKIDQAWNAFDAPAEKLPIDFENNLLQKSQTVDPFFKPVTSSDYHQYGNSFEVWNAFGGSTGNLPQTSFPNSLHKSESLDATHEGLQFGGTGPYMCNSEDYKNAFERSKLEDGCSAPTLSLGSIIEESSISSSTHPAMEVSHFCGKKSINPFDIPFDSDPEPENMFLSMSSLQTALPSPQLPTTYLDGLSEPWFLHSSVSPFVPVTSNGGFTFMPGQGPSSQLQSLSSQNPVASLSGNPFG